MEIEVSQIASKLIRWWSLTVGKYSTWTHSKIQQLQTEWKCPMVLNLRYTVKTRLLLILCSNHNNSFNILSEDCVLRNRWYEQTRWKSIRHNEQNRKLHPKTCMLTSQFNWYSLKANQFAILQKKYHLIKLKKNINSIFFTRPICKNVAEGVAAKTSVVDIFAILLF